MNGSEVSLAALAIVGTISASLVWVVKFLFTRNDKTLNRLADSIDKSADASHALQASIKERDARDREFHSSVMKNFKQITRQLGNLDSKADSTLEAISATKVTNQHIDTQIVKHEVVQNKKKQ